MSDRPIFLYLHIPKTGGSTLGSILYEQYHDGSQSKAEAGYFRAGVYYLPDGFIRGAGRDLTETDLRAIRRPDVRAVLGHFSFGVDKHLERASKYMTMLRDPVQRVLSLYYHLREYDQLPPGMTVEHFVTSEHVWEACNDQVRRIAGASTATACDQSTLETAMAHVEHAIDLVGITERFDASLLLAKQTFGWAGKINYVPRLVNTARKRRSAETPETIGLIAEHNGLDIELYRFANVLLDRRIEAEGSGFVERLEAYTQENRELLEAYGPASQIS
jgi:hypothetical protein